MNLPWAGWSEPESNPPAQDYLLPPPYAGGIGGYGAAPWSLGF